MANRKRSRDEPGKTRERCLAVAIRLIQERGYNGFSFQDIAHELAISHVAVHHHFATKADLVVAALNHYDDAFAGELAAIDARRLDAGAALRAYVQLFAQTLAEGERVCLCGMLIAELTSLPAAAKPLVRRFYERNEAWLTTVLQRGERAPGLKAPASAAAFLAMLQGAMLTARAFGERQRLTTAADLLIGQLAESTPTTPKARSRQSRHGSR